MKIYYPLFTLLILFNNSLFASIPSEVQRHTLPVQHPARELLDQVFSNPKIPLTITNLKALGFKLTTIQGAYATTLTHRSIPGYVFKIEHEKRRTQESWRSWLKRINGANVIRQQINLLGYQRYFKVPNKWIYPLTGKSGATDYVLIAEDMGVLKGKNNYRRWGKLRNKEILKKLVDVIRPVGACDSSKADNIPWCVDGRIAFVDTEQCHLWPINYPELLIYLNKHMHKFWENYTAGKNFPENSSSK